MRVTDALRAGAATWRRRLLGSGAILLYHRVTAVPRDPQLLCVHPQRFRAQMELLRNAFIPLPLPEMVRLAKRGLLPRRSVAVTFDDGYHDNLHEALPALTEFGIPATFFVAGNASVRAEPFYWDALENVFLHAGPLPACLRVRASGTTHEWRLTHDDAAPAEDGVVTRHALYQAVCRAVRPLGRDQRSALLASLHAWAGITPCPRPSHRALTDEEIRILAAAPGVEIGAHTVDHLWLAAHTRDVQREQVDNSRRALEQLLGQPVSSFAYPYGAPTSYSAATIDVVRSAGFQRACANVPRRVERCSDVMQLPRYLVRDVTAETLRTQMEASMP